MCSKALSSPSETKAFCASVQKWIQSRVARHKFLRGGVVVVDVIPKRSVSPIFNGLIMESEAYLFLQLISSPAGKILRRELRDRARKEFEAEELLLKAATVPKAKL